MFTYYNKNIKILHNIIMKRFTSFHISIILMKLIIVRVPVITIKLIVTERSTPPKILKI